MAVLVVSEGTNDYDTVFCVICLQKVPLNSVAAGSLYANGHQAFACNTHLHDRTRWITEWSTFDTRQQEQPPYALEGV
ncbi:MAG TPA: hypothetical protein VFT16_04405 [Candidatus Saccharimonadales bacterium]|nr:hypothetical protein [Candidatus Saccharimonadales bacterium]